MTKIRHFLMRAFSLACLAVLSGLVAGPALAQQPTPWQLGFQDAHSPIMERMTSFHDFLLWIIFVISIFVLILLLYVIVRFREKANPNPSKVTHNTLVEILWTVIPVVILFVIGFFSLPLLYATDDTTDADLTIKAIGNQWNWTYEYLLYRDENGVETDVSGIEFTSNMLPQDALLADTRRDGSLYKGETDYHVVIPSNTVVRFNVTASDVLHAFAMPAFGMKVDAIPGHMNNTWALVNPGKEGLYIGQCSEICGDRHSFMPIAIDALPKEEFLAWVGTAKGELESGAIGPSLPARYDNQVASAN